VQFVPLGVAVVGFAAWRWNRRHWDWLAAMPWLVGLSLLVAPYGAWAHDGVLLLVPILAAARFDPSSVRARLGLLVYLLANVAGYVTYLMHAYGETYVWLNPTVLAACWFCKPTGLLAGDCGAGESSLEDSLDPPYKNIPVGVSS
jgi:hypothetical protein